MCELLFVLYSQLLKIVSAVEDWKLANVVPVFKERDPGEICGVTELQMFPSCYSCLNRNSYECNVPFGCINTLFEYSSLTKSFR